MYLPRAIQLDRSDLEIFNPACQPGEWAVPGTFAFADTDLESADRKQQLAFRTAWLGVESFGHTTLVEIAEIDEAGFFRTVEQLAQHLVIRYGAPSLAAALPAARAELDDAASLSDHKLGTLLAIEREMTDDGVKERVRVIKPERAQDHARIWTVAED
ncbi:hypothetical protein HBA54_16795 [Pelagibius litoralis]|uniref:Uncharacterized protein n=1 Tax=Pelagibius litoralis TaxID=374515 RepID=A0A967EZF9_9PROT|nr:DUF6505 family protein [Pelagibius litoralis]NIA70267.1 hypothetical protein [Pelagibius litoralis]